MTGVAGIPFNFTGIGFCIILGRIFPEFLKIDYRIIDHFWKECRADIGEISFSVFHGVDITGGSFGATEALFVLFRKLIVPSHTRL